MWKVKTINQETYFHLWTWVQLYDPPWRSYNKVKPLFGLHMSSLCLVMGTIHLLSPIFKTHPRWESHVEAPLSLVEAAQAPITFVDWYQLSGCSGKLQYHLLKLWYLLLGYSEKMQWAHVNKNKLLENYLIKLGTCKVFPYWAFGF